MKEMTSHPRTHLAPPLHQVHHAVELVRGAEAGRAPVEAERPPGAAVPALAPEENDLDHRRTGVLGAHRRPLALIAQTGHIRASLLRAPQALEHVYRVRGVGFASPRGVHG